MTVSPDGNFKRSKAEEEGEAEGGRVRGEGAMGLKVLTLLGCTWRSGVLWGLVQLNGHLGHLENYRLSGGHRCCSG